MKLKDYVIMLHLRGRVRSCLNVNSGQLIEFKDGTNPKHQQAGHGADHNGSTNVFFLQANNILLKRAPPQVVFPPKCLLR